MTATKQVPLTIQARAIMRSFGRDTIYTNKYENCRTVKCYAPDHWADATADDILAALNKLPNCSAKMLHCKRAWPWSPRVSIIVRIPL